MSARRSGEPAFSRALDAARSNTRAGHEWLWNRFSRQVNAFATAQGSEDPEGITNEVFLATFRNLAQFQGDEDGFVSLLFSIARNKLVDEHRRRGRRPLTAPLESTTDPSGGDTEEDAMRGLGDTTIALLAHLTDDQREVLVLRLVADLSLEQTAAITGRSVNATKALQHRAVNALRKTSAKAVTR